MSTTIQGRPEASSGSPPGDARFPQWLLNTGFFFALVVAAACLVLSSWYLFTFLRATNAAIENLLTAAQTTGVPATVIQLGIVARTAMARFALLSCGVSVGMGFGFLGFALFLIGVKGEMDVAAQTESAKIKIARMAPGVFVILCAAVLIAVCITFRAEYEFTGQESTSTPPAATDTLPHATPSPALP